MEDDPQPSLIVDPAPELPDPKKYQTHNRTIGKVQIPLRSISISVVKNEADVIEAMVRHNLQYLDHMSIVDNGSVDGTFDILNALRDEGLPLDVRQSQEPGHLQQHYINAFLLSGDCDRSAYIFALDADEFINCSLSDYRAFIASAPRSFLMRWKTYVPTESDASQESNVLNT